MAIGKRVLFVLLLCLLLLFCACEKTKPSFLSDTDLAPVDLRVAVGGECPKAEDFLSDDARARCRQEGVTVEFAAAPDFEVVGAHKVTLLLRVSNLSS
jgi:hypothetical protein